MSLIQGIVSLLDATLSDTVRVNNMVLTFPNSKIQQFYNGLHRPLIAILTPPYHGILS